MHGLVTFLKACAVMGLALMGVAMTIHNRSHFGGPEPFGIGAALLVGALIAFSLGSGNGPKGLLVDAGEHR